MRRCTSEARAVAVGLALGSCLVSRSARADPQWSAGAVPSACILGDSSGVFQTAAFCGALRGDVLFGRQSTADIGFGPFASVGTAAFDDVRIAAGASALLPVIDDAPLVLSLGGLLRNGTEAGAEANLFWGVRSYNFHSSWNFAAGVVLGVQRTFGDSESSVISLGLQVDGLVFALPVLLVAGAVQ